MRSPATVNSTAFLIVDPGRCFFPAEEGERLGLPGFGELGVSGAEAIIEPINRITRAGVMAELVMAYTLDKHPPKTAHFSDTPNYVNTWPVHGVDGKPGSEPHPDLLIVQEPQVYESVEFIKGDTVAKSPEDDTSYTGALAHIRDTKILLPVHFRLRQVTRVIIAGLALGDGEDNKLCVDSTAADLLAQGFEVALITDATEAVLPGNKEKAIQNLAKLGVKMITSQEFCKDLSFSARY